MRLIPSIVPVTASRAEKEVFSALEKASVAGIDVALHSLLLRSHERKRMGEIDFLLVGKAGVFVLEIKGGGITRVEGRWVYLTARGPSEDSEGPFVQARTAMFSLEKEVRTAFPELRHLALGYGVVFPDSEFGIQSVEWPQQCVLDRPRLRTEGIAAFLADVLAYWRGATKWSRDLTSTEVGALITWLRPEFEQVRSLRYQADDVEAMMVALTDEQYGHLDAVEANRRVLCEGGAGTGKTFLALETARRHASRGQTVAVACYSSTLASFIESRLGRVERVSVLALDNPASRAPIMRSPVDVLVVDEAQDLMTLDDLEVLDKGLSGGLAGGTWRFFLDSNHQAGLLGRHDEEALEMLKSYQPVLLHLTRNCRNTSEIVTQTRLMTGADLGTAIAGHGPKVRFLYHSAPNEVPEILHSLLDELDVAGVEPADVIILSPRQINESIVGTDASLGKRVKPFFAPDLKRGHVRFGSVADFKGQESQFAIVIELEGVESEYERSLLYVAATRARAGLTVILSHTLKDAVQRISMKNLELVMASMEEQR